MRRSLEKIIFVAIVLLWVATFNTYAEESFRLATTTSLYETGLLDHIIPIFERENNCKVHIISVGTGKAIKLAENGDVDIILVHAKVSEEKFIREGYGVKRYGIMHNNFVILGPNEDPAQIRNLKGNDIKEILKRIYGAEHTFVSRGDDSGTHKKEKYLWSMAGIKPSGSWYLETGQGMNSTLRIADEKNAYILVDSGTYLFNKDRIRLVKLAASSYKELVNPYGVTAVNPKRHPHVNYSLSTALIKWLLSDRCQEMISNYRVNANQLFYID